MGYHNVSVYVFTYLGLDYNNLSKLTEEYLIVEELGPRRFPEHFLGKVLKDKKAFLLELAFTTTYLK